MNAPQADVFLVMLEQRKAHPVRVAFPLSLSIQIKQGSQLESLVKFYRIHIFINSENYFLQRMISFLLTCNDTKRMKFYGSSVDNFMMELQQCLDTVLIRLKNIS